MPKTLVEQDTDLGQTHLRHPQDPADDPRILASLQETLLPARKNRFYFYLGLPTDMAVVQCCHGAITVAAARPACFISNDGYRKPIPGRRHFPGRRGLSIDAIKK